MKHALAIETSTSRGSIALASGKTVVESICVGERFEHSSTLIPHLDQLLITHRLRAKDLDLLCVSKGPGSFTGIRVGVACAKGLAMGLGAPLIGVSTLEVLLSGFLKDPLCPLKDLPKVKRIVLSLNAKKGEFFMQAWHLIKSRWVPEPARVVLEESLHAQLRTRAEASILVSPQLSKLRGVIQLRVHWDIKDRFPDAADLVCLGMERFRRQRKGDKDVKPFYLRKTDAELLFKNKSRSVFRWERAN